MLERGHRGYENQRPAAPLNNREGGREASETRTTSAALIYWSMTLDGLESERIAAENRLRALTQADIEPDPAASSVADLLATAEHQATLALRRVLRQSPYGGWVKEAVGIGEKQGARLIAAIGDPTWNAAADRPRRDVAELWAYCGYVPGQRRQKGQRSNWNGVAKMRAFLCAESCMKVRSSPFRTVYDERRAWTAQTHPEWTDGHSHNDALRITAKAILEDLFNFGRPEALAPSVRVPAAQELAGAIELAPRRTRLAPARLAEAITTSPPGHGNRASADLEVVA